MKSEGVAVGDNTIYGLVKRCSRSIMNKQMDYKAQEYVNKTSLSHIRELIKYKTRAANQKDNSKVFFESEPVLLNKKYSHIQLKILQVFG